MADGVSWYRRADKQDSRLSTSMSTQTTHEVSSRDISDYRFSLFFLTQILLVCTTLSSSFPSSFSPDMSPGFLGGTPPTPSMADSSPLSSLSPYPPSDNPPSGNCVFDFLAYSFSRHCCRAASLAVFYPRDHRPAPAPQEFKPLVYAGISSCAELGDDTIRAAVRRKNSFCASSNWGDHVITRGNMKGSG